jgi:hypothetical protein
MEARDTVGDIDAQMAALFLNRHIGKHPGRYDNRSLGLAPETVPIVQMDGVGKGVGESDGGRQSIDAGTGVVVEVPVAAARVGIGGVADGE